MIKHMKNFSLFLLAFCFAMSIQAQKNVYEIGIKIKGLKQGDNLLLANYFGDQSYRRDTCSISKDGFGYFRGNEKLQRGMYRVATSDMKVFDILIDDDQHFKLETDSTNFNWYHTMKVTGSVANEMYKDYVFYITEKAKERQKYMDSLKIEKDSVRIKEYKNKINGFNKDVDDYKVNLIETRPDELLSKFFNGHREPRIPETIPDSLKALYYKQHYWDNIDFDEEGLVRAPQNLITKKIDYYMDNLVRPDPDSIKVACDYLINLASGDRELDKYFIWYLGQKFQKSNIMCFDDVYVHIAQKYYCTGRAWWVDSALIAKICEETTKASHVLCNKMAPNMLNLDTADIPRELYKEAGTYTFIFFWDPTCSHCKKVVPILDSIFDANKDKNWTVYAVASENKYVEWREYIRKHPEIHDWVNVCKSSKYAPWPYRKRDYNNLSNPTIYIIDKDKRVIAKKIQEGNLAEFMEHMVKEDKKKLQAKGD